MKRTPTQQKTIDSFQKIDEHVYSLVYCNEYGLDRLLKEGVSSTGGLLSFAVREMKRRRKSFACSSFSARTEEGKPIMGRNFDYMDAPLIVVWTTPEQGYKSIAVANCTFMIFGKKSIYPMKKRREGRLLLAPYCCMDGINEKGLSIAVLEIKTKATNQKNGKTNLTTTTVIRTVLDTCQTVEEAVNVFQNCAMHDAIFTNYHFHITDATGKSVIIEYVKNQISVVMPEEKSFQVLTNYFLTEGGDNRKGFGYERHDYIEKTIQEKDCISEAEGMKILENCHLHYKHKRGYQIITLWSAVYNATDKTMTLCAGLDYETVYRFAVDKPGEVEKISRTAVDSVPDFDFPHIDKEMV